MRYEELIKNIKACKNLYMNVDYGDGGINKEFFKAVKKDVLKQLWQINSNNVKCQGIKNFEFEATITRDCGKGFDLYIG